MKMHVFIKITVLALLPVVALQAASIHSWKSGATTVTLSREGTLTVSGNGAMADYDYRTDDVALDVIRERVTKEHYDSLYIAPWFDFRKRIVNVVIEEGVTHIGSDMFVFGCDSLMSVTIPNSVTSIGKRAFKFCNNLTSVSIHSNVASIGESAFWGSTSIEVAIDNPNYRLEGGILFNKNKTALMLYPHSRQGAYVIPPSVTSIEETAFMGCTSLTSITIPNGVTSIGEEAFLNCRGLTSITIPNGVTSIGNWAFMACDGLTSITIPNSVTSIGMGAFYSCRGLTSVTIDNSVTSIGERAFEYCGQLTSVTLGNGVTSIGKKAFYGCNNLTSITIPNSVTSIGEMAFGLCRNLMSVTLGNGITSIEESTFDFCQSLKSIVIPDGVTSIGLVAFSNCTSMTSLTIPKSVTSIEANAFSRCVSLKSVTILNPTPPKLGYRVFRETNGYVCLYIPKGSLDVYFVDEWRQFFGCFETIASDKSGWTGKPGVLLAIVILSVLLLPAAVFVIIKKSRKSFSTRYRF